MGEICNTRMSPPHKKRKEEASPVEQEQYLADDLVVNILARVSRTDHAAISVASKRYRSVVASPDLYKSRSLMGATETNIYVCLRIPHYPSPGWYILRRRKTLDGGDLIPIPCPRSQAPEASSVVVVDWGIYVIGGMKKRLTRTSDVWLLDCRTHTWSKLPSMGVARAYAAAGVVDGKIYVIGGGCHEGCTWGEVFDPKTQTWDDLPPMPKREPCNINIHDCVVSDQRVYAVDEMEQTFYYSPSQGEWGKGNFGPLKFNRRDWCVVDNLICCISGKGTIFWCEADELDPRKSKGMMIDTKFVFGLESLKDCLRGSRVIHFGEYLLDEWKYVKSAYGNCTIPELRRKLSKAADDLEDLLPGARLINSGRNIVLFWDVIKGGCLEIWCAEISLERWHNIGRGEVKVAGNVQWSNAVMTIDPFIDRYKVLYSVSVTL